jgi:isoleucyl-tRNA synthetase
MYDVLEAFTRWIAPVLSFTADEIWTYLPGQHSPSVFLERWYEHLPVLDDPRFDQRFWATLLNVRVAVAKELEKLRVAGGIGSSLDAEVDLYCDGAIAEGLRRVGDELRFVFITSYARVHPAGTAPEHAKTSDIEGLMIAVAPSDHPKCGRCWHHREDVGTHPQHPTLCGRCIQNIAGGGESRQYA